MQVTPAEQEELTGKTDEGLLYLTETGQEKIAPWVTSVTEAVYVLQPEADAQSVAAAMARLSRNSNDLRAIIASEFFGEKGKDIALLRRVVNTFGDDSVMQLYPIQLVFEGISNLATKEVEWGRLGAYLEQSTRYLRFDRKDQRGHYTYVTPSEFDKETARLYEDSLNKIFDIYSGLYTRLYDHITGTSDVPDAERDGAWRRACHAQACDGVRSLLPAATKATVGVVGSAQAVNNMIFHLLAHELPEMQTLGQEALKAVREVAPVFFERTDLPTRGELITNHQRETRRNIDELATSLLVGLKEKKTAGPSVRLISAESSEDEVITKILSDSSTYSFQTVGKVVEKLSDKEKQNIIDTYVGDRYNRRAKPGRAFELPHYLFEVECDYGAFRDIQRHRMVDGLEWQPLRIDLGYTTPDIIHEAKLAKGYKEAFTISKDLYNTLHERGYGEQAQYATLFGHIMRFNVKMNARSLTHTAELRTSPQGHPAYRKVYQEMHEQVASVHPHIAKAMRFVSQDEDEALARLGAEKYAQAKFGDN